MSAIREVLQKFLGDRRGRLITITGIDGAGKSTLARSVEDDLRERGYDATYVYGRFLPVLSFPLMEFGRRFVLTDSDMDQDYEQHQERKRSLFDNDILPRLYEGIVMLDYTPQLLYKIVRPLYTYDVVVCDRFVYDTLLSDLAGDVISSPESAVQKYDFYEQFVPKPDLEYYVDVPVETAFDRKDDVPDISYLEDRKEFYDYFAESRGQTVIDGTKSIPELREKVVSDIVSLR